MKTLCFGFDQSTDSLRLAAEAVRAGGATELSWLLHPNRRAQGEPVLRELGIRVFSAEEGHGLAPQGRPPETPEAEHDLAFLMDREGRFAHEWERTLALERLRQRVFDVYSTVDPDVVLFGEVPHAAMSYLPYLWARRFGVPTVIMRWGPTPFHVSHVTEIDDRLLDQIGGAAPEGVSPSESSSRFIASLRRSHAEPPPVATSRMNSVVGRARDRLASGRIPTDPRIVKVVARRQALRRRYEADAVSLSEIRGPLVSVFLHLQPERTTCPEGGRFVQQWLAVSELRRVFPPEWTILVREHPATFVGSSRLVQHPEFYDAVTEMDNVFLASHSGSAYQLADRSDWVATVTGTIAQEASARGRPSIVFGNSVHRGCAGVIDASSLASIADLGDLDAVMATGLPIERFLAAFDASPRSAAAEWTPETDVRGIRTSGAAVASLLPRAVAEAASTRPEPA